MHPGSRILARTHILIAILLVLRCASLPAAAQPRLPPGLAWCGGITDPADLPACRAAGFDAVRLDVPWTPNANWEGIDRLLAAAREAGLKVVLALQAATPPGAAGPVDADNAEYVAQVKEWIRGVVERYRGNDTVLAWMTPDEPEAALRPTEEGLRAFVASRYKELGPLNAAWRATFRSPAEVSAAAALALDRQQPLGIGRAGIDMALYQQLVYVRVMALWARAVRGADESRPLVTGATARYRCLISVPDDYDAVAARVAPGPETLAIARRGGRFGAIAAIASRDLAAGLGTALMQGAAGILVEDWRGLRERPDLRAKLGAVLSVWRQGDGPNAVPRPTVAILYEPFAESFPPSPLATGYLAGLDHGDVAPLFAALRHGTRYGQVACLAQDDLREDRLAGYRVLLCPMALSLTPEQARALRRFAEAGGVVVADVGLGCCEAGGSAQAWTPELGDLLGVRAFWPAVPGGGSLRIYEKSTLFPSLRPGDIAGAGPGAPAFGEPAVMMEPADGAAAYAAVVDRTVVNRRMFGGLLVHPIGKGWLVYASMKLWQRWSPADPVYLLFHYDLLSRRPAVALRGLPFLGADVQVAAFERGLVVRNSGTRARLVEVDVADERLLAGSCLNVCRPATEEGLDVRAGLDAGGVGLYERTPVRCVITRGSATVAVEEYDPEGIRLAVCGGPPRISLDRTGNAVMRPSLPQEARITIGDGRYPVRPGSVHLLRAKDLESGKVQEHRIRVGQDAKIEVRKTFFCDAISLRPVSQAGPQSDEAGGPPAAARLPNAP